MLPKRRIPVELGKHRGMNPQYGLKKGDWTSPFAWNMSTHARYAGVLTLKIVTLWTIQDTVVLRKMNLIITFSQIALLASVKQQIFKQWAFQKFKCTLLIERVACIFVIRQYSKEARLRWSLMINLPLTYLIDGQLLFI